MYDLPSLKDLKKIYPVFCSYFFKWNSEKNLKIAKRFGFQTLKKNAEGTYRNYVGIDEKINRIHQYLKYLKFGYGRATDHACEDIRNNRMTRDKAIKLVKKFDRKKISKFYKNKDLEVIKKDDCIKTLELLNSFYVSSELNKEIFLGNYLQSKNLGKKNEIISKLYRLKK